MRINTFLKILCILLISIHFSGILSAQVPVTRSENKVIIEGKVFYLHSVKPGQTLYSISNAYNVPEPDIAKDNPGADLDLKAGQVLKIPLGNNAASTPVPPDSVHRRHQVLKGQTMFSIAKLYNITVADLENANPEVVNNEIKVGQWLEIPSLISESELTDFFYHKVRRKETIYGISKMYGITEDNLIKYNPELKTGSLKNGQNLKIPANLKEFEAAEAAVPEHYDSTAIEDIMNYDTAMIAGSYSFYLDSLPEISNRDFNVAYLIPFNYRIIDTLVPVITDRKPGDDNIQNDQTEDPNDQMLSSRNFLEFLEGSLLAVDSLKNEGMSVNVFVFDTQKKPERIEEILSSREFQKIDLIIGPFYSFEVEKVSEFSKNNRIPMISPLSSDLGPVQSNPFLFQLNPGYKTEFSQLADYISGFIDRNIIFIRGTDSVELTKYNFLKEEYLKRAGNEGLPDSLFLKEIIYDLALKANLPQDIQKVLSEDKPNLVIIPETDEALVSTVVTQLFFQLKTYNISIIGMPHWSTFQNIDYTYFHTLLLSYLTPYYFSYNTDKVRHFLKDFRYTYYAEPVTLTKKGGSYAFIGYDCTFHFMKSISKYGRRFILHLNDFTGSELMNEYFFTSVSEKGGFENRSLILVKFTDNLNIIAEPAPHLH